MSKLNFKELEDLLLTANRKESTVRMYKYIYEKYMRNLDVDDKEEIKKILLNRNIPLSTRSFIRVIIFNYYVRVKNMRKEDIILPIVGFESKERDIYFEPKEMLKVLEYAKKKDIKVYLMIKIVWETGLRRALLLNLKPNMIDKNEGLIKISDVEMEGNKGKKKFKTKMEQETLEELKKFIKDNNIGEYSNIFRFESNYPPGTVSSMFMTHAKKAGIADWIHFTPHVIRHSHATHYSLQGGAIEHLSYSLGHRDLKSTRRYMHKEEEGFKKDRNKISFKL